MHSNSFINLPLIDVSKTIDQQSGSEEYSNMDKACKTYGAFFLSGIESRTQFNLQGLFSEAAHFFNLDLSVKKRYIASADNRYLGYRGIGSEFSELAHRQYEPCEQYKVGYLNDLKNNTSTFGVEAIQAHGSIFKKHVQAGFHSLDHIGAYLLSIIANNLNLGEHYFADYCNHPNHQLGLNCYPSEHHLSNHNNPDQYGMSAHKDLCLITIIAQDKPGLMLKDIDGEWKIVPYIPNTLIIMLGEFMEVWTDGYYLAPLHQVLKSTTERRLSVIYKLRPNYDAKIPVIAGINPHSNNRCRTVIHTGKAYDNKLKNIMYIDKGM
ncbi:oxidoreductase, 2OG-Fe(II) oxygenase family [Legionella gratiana]|uniref:2-oxoglutarate-dependent ethylene/succinate-forming enzyme n=1 Tax=Legionella gratiana TaxID=45066 RepID=A0A378J0J8_9GAMM|nr:2OG-Fe(II) oxygenase family protein [Legionella gratiana]KTD11692.1 oxidoreductase, 2OG-Fe(II) oxygenase family [Legionella gratiana]STX40838.1 oxidoreductase, 2OG-Fe(II) oxygenase family [Legionella gratiana]